MAKKKRDFRNRKQYTPEQKYRYHKSIDVGCGKFGIEYGSPRHCYSSGFADAFSGRNNTAPTTREFGKKSGKSYAFGYERGRKCARKYFLDTGKQPADLKY